jgi:hypothetical protein
VLLRADHMARLAFVVSLLIHRDLDCVRATSPAVVVRELLPRSSPVFARLRQMSDHHTDVSLLGLCGAAARFSPSSPFLRSGPFKMPCWKRTGTLVFRLMDWRECPILESTLTVTRVGVSHSSSLVGARSGVGVRSSLLSATWGHLKIPTGGIV